jgi:hypothetical protein
LTWTTRLGGKAGLAPAARLSLKAGQAGESESLAPLADDRLRRVETGGDEVVGEAIGSQEDDPGANNVAIR